ncbi:MAG: DNA-3-methyladenine glycosylase 2 family protein [Sphingomonadales bacterium]|nr:MAG: DNA-3-methyladenine glycosylase 2 family protein [Sphingomonadales bacterium]
MGLSAEHLESSLRAVAGDDPVVRVALEAVGTPAPRIAARGYAALLRALVAQQLSVKAAAAIHGRLAALIPLDDPQALLAQDDDSLRGCGLSRPKIAYARALAEAVATGQLALDALPADDEAAVAAIGAVKGFGRWSAEVYLVFAEGRADILPAGDLALQEATRRLLRLEARPSEKALRDIGARWRPHRGAMAIFLWHYYANTAPL